MTASKDSVTTGQFDRRITIQNPIISAGDGQGGAQVIVWNNLYSCWADIQNFPHARGLLRNFMFQQLYPTMTTIVATRYIGSIHFDASMRIIYMKNGLQHNYKIIGIENPGEANKSLLFLCQEDQAQGVN